MVSKKIKGITIEIGADPTGLDKALKDVEKGANKVRSELREVNSAMKNAPESAVLWTQKQNLLTKAIEESKKKLDFLKNAQEQVEKQFRNKEIGEEQYRAFQREVEKAGAELKYFEDALSDFESTAENASDDMRKLGDTAENTGEQAEESGDGFTILKGTIADLAADGINKAIDSFKELASEGDTALDTLQAKTGATAEQIKEYRDIMTNLYGNNYGENKTDIADSIAAVKQQLGNISSEELEEVTEQALLLRDTFGYEVSGSIRTAKMLMDQFELSADEAYTLIAQGAQNGIDKNGDLLDTVNEYAVHYKQLGYNSEEFFNSLKNGTDAGTFSVDKLGDAMKEFGIRTKDTAKSTDEAYAALGVNAKQMRTAFAEGGENARIATDTILTALFSMEDKVKQNQTGVNLFGTMWEDLGADGIKALSDINGQADKTASTLDDINNIRYDNIGSQTTSLKRKIETELYEPLIKKLIPKAEKGIDAITRNLPKVIDSGKKLIPVVKGAGVAFATWKIANTVKPGVTAVKSLIDSVKNGSTVMGGFNAVLKANPIGTVTTAIGVATTAIDYFRERARWKEDDKEKALTALVKEEYKEAAGRIRDTSDSLKEMRDSLGDQTGSIELETEKTKELWEELQTLAGIAGKVKDADKTRAEYILNELNEALGTEYEITGNQIENYQTMQTEIDKLIEKKRAMAYIDAYAENEAEYAKIQQESLEEYSEAKKEYEKNGFDIEQFRIKVSQRSGRYIGNYEVLGDFLNSLDEGEVDASLSMAGVDIDALKSMRGEYDELYANYLASRRNMNNAKNNYKEATKYQNKLSEAQKAVSEERYDEVAKILWIEENALKELYENEQNHFEERKKAYKEFLEKKRYELELAIENEDRTNAEAAAKEIAEALEYGKAAGMNKGDGFITEYKKKIEEMDSAGLDTSILDEFGKQSGESAGTQFTSAFVTRMQALKAINNAGVFFGDAILNAINIPMFADGGFLRKGQGIVAEEGPELIEIINGGARITPLTPSARNTPVSGASGNNNKVVYINNTINATVSGDYDVRRLAERLSEEQKNAERNMGL